MLGKTTTPEFGWKAIGDCPLTGISRNPWNPDTTPGGSSSGAGIGAAAGLGPLHQGSDGAGSIRIPASFCGVFGLKPSYGRVPQWPVSNNDYTTHVGPMTRTVADAALMMSAMAGPDEWDRTSLEAAPADYVSHLRAGIKGLRVAWSPTLGGLRVDPDVAARDPGGGPGVRRPRRPRGGGGARVARHLRRDPHHVVRAHGRQLRGASPPVARPHGSRAGRMHRGGTSALDGRLHPGPRPEAGGVGCHAPDLRHLRPDADAHGVGDGAAGGTPQPGALAVSTPWNWIGWASFSYPFNFTGQPAATVPAGFAPSGLPVGLQIVGRRFADLTVLQAAAAYEEARPWASRRPRT